MRRKGSLVEILAKVGKREVEYGGVRLRKVVKTEVVNQPVELTREEIVIERVPAGQEMLTLLAFVESSGSIFKALRISS